MPHTHKVAGSNPAGNIMLLDSGVHVYVFNICFTKTEGDTTVGSYGVMVSTLDFESSDPSSNLGRT